MPIAAAHIFLEDTSDDVWERVMFPTLRLDAVDHLIISPLIVDPDGSGHCILEKEQHRGPRVHAVVKKAREEAQKAHRTVKIFGMQFWGTTALHNLTTDTLRATYVASMPKVLAKYDLDGFDIDYEWNKGSVGNLQPWVPKFLHDIRQALDQFGKENNRHYDLAITPATPACLHPTKLVGGWYSQFNQEAKTYPVNKSVNYVNVQTYEGGRFSAHNTIAEWTASIASGGLGFQRSQVLCGIVSEEGQESPENRKRDVSNPAKNIDPTLEQTIQDFQNNGNPLAGIHLWRLNANIAWSNQAQAVLFNWLHGANLPNTMSLNQAKAEWNKNTA